MRLSICGYSRFLLLSFSLGWLALYGGLPMMTLILRLFWRLMRATFSSLTLPNRSAVHARGGGVQAHVVQRVHEAEVGKFGVLAGDGGVGGFDVQVGDVVGQDGDFVGVQLVLVFVLQLGGLAAKVLHQLADEGAGAGGRVEDLHVLVDQVLAEVLFAEPVGAVDHEAHDLVGRIDHAQPVGGLGVVDLVEVLVDDLEEGLLLVVAADLRGGGADRGVVGLQALERVLLQAAGEEVAFQRVQLARDVVVLVKVAVVEDLGEDFFGQDVLDQHLAHVGLGQAGVDGLLRMGQELLPRPRGSRRWLSCSRSIISRRACSTAGRSALNCSTASRKPAISGRSKPKNSLSSLASACGVGHVAAQHLVAVLPQHGGGVVEKMMLSCG